MADDFTDHERSLMEKMTPQHRVLMEALNPREKKSLSENVKTPDDIERIQSWVGSDPEIEQMLFWDRGGKFDDPAWQSLQPVDDITRRLYEKATEYLGQLKKESVVYQRRSDLTLLSQFITPLLFSGLAGAVRCTGDGSTDPNGGFFKGIELRCIGSIEDHINSITIYPVEDNELEVHFGSREDGAAWGIWVYTGDSHSILQLAQFVGRTLGKTGFSSTIKTGSGETLTLDAKAIRRAAMEGERLDYEPQLRLFCSDRTREMTAALDKAEELQRGFYERFGLEVECYNIGKACSNFKIMREDNFQQYVPDTAVSGKGLVMLTATLVCRRCRRELKDFLDMARSFPEATFALVNLSSPQFTFYERVFGDMSGGDVQNFRKNASGVTPFVIIYTPDKNGILTFREYISTGKADSPPSKSMVFPVLEKYFM
jgi:hypothetical protein